MLATAAVGTGNLVLTLVLVLSCCLQYYFVSAVCREKCIKLTSELARARAGLGAHAYRNNNGITNNGHWQWQSTVLPSTVCAPIACKVRFLRFLSLLLRS